MRKKMKLKDMTRELQKNLSSERFIHSVNVMETAQKLAAHYREDADGASVAGLLHDCGKIASGEEMLMLCDKYGVYIDDVCVHEPGLLHAPLGAVLAKKTYGVSDQGILDSIRTHTTGAVDMSLLQKIVFIADFIEPGRVYKKAGVMREQVFNDLNKALLTALDSTIQRVIEKKRLLHKDTVDARNFILAGK